MKSSPQRTSATVQTLRLLLLSLLALIAHAHAAVANLIKESKLAGGIACFINPADSSAAFALAKEGKFLVHVAAADASKAEDFREQAAAAGLLGRSLYVEHRADGTLPFGDHFIDLVIVPESADEKEVLRVLAPVRGRAFIGARMISKPALAGADDWTHRLHGADNNPVSGDTAFQGPPFLQYLATPMQTSFQGGMLAAGGRRFELSDWVTKKPDRNEIAGAIRARSLHNGLLLWERDLPKNIEPDMPLCVVDAQHVYLADSAGCHVLVLDAETGAEVRKIVLGDNADLRVNWLGLENGRLHALLGPPLEVRTALTFFGGANEKKREKNFESGHTLVAWDLKSERELWRHKEATTIDYHTIAVREGCVYFYSEKTRLACLGADGKLLWEYADPKFIERLPRPSRFANINTESVSTLLVGPKGTLRFAVPGRPAGFIFDSVKGTLLWEDSLAAPKCFFLDATYLSPGGVFDAFTGSKVGEVKMEGAGCGIVTWVPGLDGALGHVSLGVKSPCGVGTFAACGVLVYSPSQCDCWPFVRGAAGFASANNIIAQAAEHATHPLVKGDAPAAALRAASGDWPQYRGDVRRSGAAEMKAPATAELRTIVKGEHALPLPDGHDMHRMEWLDRPTSPVTAGGMAFHASSDGSVRATHLADGKSAWTYWTGGAVFSAPSFADGRVFVGSADGWVHCLDAATGKLAWRWRGAPAEHAMMVYGKLMSAWPMTAVMAHEGTLYGIAGQWMQNGSVAFALDTATGAAKWTRWTAPGYGVAPGAKNTLYEREDHAFSPCGQLAMVGGHLWVRGHLGVPAIFDAKSGARLPLSPDFRKLAGDPWALGFRTASAGQDILVLDDHTVLQGGHALLSNPDMRHDKSAAKYVAWMTDAQGRISASPLPQWAVPHSQIAPAVQGDDVLIVGGVGKDGRSANSTIGLSLWSMAAWKNEYTAKPGAKTQAATDADAADPTAPKGKAAAKDPAKAEIGNFKTTLDMSKARWRIDEMDVNAIALTADTAIVAHGIRESYGRFVKHPGFKAWQLTALDRQTGKPRWNIALPCEPIFNGLAAAADGRWVLTLRDGSVAVVR